MLLSEAVMRAENSSIQGVDWVGKDMSKINQSLEQLRLYEAAFESTAFAVVITDRTGQITWANPSFTALTGYSLEEAIGQNIRILNSGRQDQAFFQNLWNTILNGKVWQSELINRKKDGSLHEEEETIIPLYAQNSEISHFIFIKQDLTEQKRRDETIQKAHQQLKELDQLRVRFFADISHELRTPLTVIRGEAEVTLRGKDKPIVEYKTALERIVQLTNQVNTLVGDLLFLSRSESGNIEITKCPLPLFNILLEVHQEALVLANRKHIAVTLASRNDTPLIVNGDPQRLRQLFMAIIDNAVNYTTPGGAIKMNLESAGAFARVVVADTGVGVTKEDLPRVFQRFFRVRQQRQDMVQTGSGLGLPIAKWITEAHDGTVSLASVLGRGTTVTIDLPLLRIPDSSSGQIGSPSFPGKDDPACTTPDFIRQKGKTKNMEKLSAVPVLSQLKTATDAGLMLEIFRSHLRSVPGKAWDIRSCEISRVRAHPGESAVILYVLRIADPHNGQERDQWVTGELDPAAHNELSWTERQAAAWSRNSKAFDTFDPVSFIEELGMLVQVYPFDRRLPGLADLVAGPLPEFEPLLLASLGAGTWTAEWTVKSVRYHVLLRSTLLYTMQAQEAESGRVECKRFYVKVYRGDKGEGMRRVLDGRSRQPAGFAVPALLAYLPHLGALVLEEAQGTSLRKLVEKGDHTEAMFSNVGRALAAFHQGDISGLPSHGLADELALLERAKAFLVSTCPHLQARIEAVFEAIKAGLQDVPPGPTHLALRLDPILVDCNRLWLIDLDSLSAADPVLDVAYFLANLASLRIRSKLDDETSRRLARSFADAYLAHVPGAWRARLPLHYAGALLKTAHHMLRRKVFRHNSQRLLDTITALLKEAEDSLAGKVW